MKNKVSVYFIVALSVSVALLHFLIGPDYSGPFKDFMRGYLIDIVLPLNLYLLLQISLRKHLTVKKARILAALLVFSFGAFTELMQYYGVAFLGRTFDPLDFLMYAAGVILGILLDLSLIQFLENKKIQ